MTKQIIRLDASALKESSCMRRLYWNVIDGWTTKINANDMEFGSAVHEYIKVMRHNPGRYDLATKAAIDRYDVPMTMKPKKLYMTKEYLVLVCQNFWMNYIEKDLFETLKDEQGKPLVELKFSWPFYCDDDVEVLLCGTIDDICKHKHGTYAIRDYKTSSVSDEETYLRGYYLSPQLMFYRLVVRYYAARYPDSIWAELERKNVHCFIDGIFLHGASKPASFARSDVFRFDDQQLGEFEQEVKRATMELVRHVKSGSLPPRSGMLNGSCTTVYGPCKYFNACCQPDALATQRTLERQYIKRVYDPLTFGEPKKES